MAGQQPLTFLDRFVDPSGTFLFTLTSNGYKLITLNLYRHLQAVKVPWKLCILCADAQSYRFLSGEGLPCVRAPSPLPDYGPQISPFGTRQFQTLNRKKLELLELFAADPRITTGVYMDGDIAVYQDFLPELKKIWEATPPSVAILLQCDEQARVDCSGNLEDSSCPTGCTGFLSWRRGLTPQIFALRGGEAEAIWKSCPEDQVFVNRRLRATGTPFRTLPRSLFPNGSYASLHTAGSDAKTTSLLLHYNYLVGDAKLKKMKANRDWILPY